MALRRGMAKDNDYGNWGIIQLRLTRIPGGRPAKPSRPKGSPAPGGNWSRPLLNGFMGSWSNGKIGIPPLPS